MTERTTIEIIRRFAASPERVFAAWIEPEQLARWYGPTHFSNEEVSVGATVGGSFRLVMVAPSGDRFPTGGEFLEVDPPSKLVYRDTSPQMSEQFKSMVRGQLEAIGADPETPIEPLVTVNFAADGDGTLLTITTSFGSEAAATAMRRMQMVEGWEESLDSLATNLA